MEKLIIGLTCSEKREMDFPSQSVNEDYIDAVIKAGAVPILLPICNDHDVIEAQLKSIDGLIITGGIDINPLCYHETYRFEQCESSTRRDEYEMKLIHMSSQMCIPILGICRGHQMINVAFGGTLFQDNKMSSPLVGQHQQKERKDYPIHSIRVKKESFLYTLFGDKYYVNSFHHQSIKKLADEFQIVARSEDSIVEAIQHDYLNIWGVQFHPEMMYKRDQKMLEIFKSFIDCCSSVKEQMNGEARCQVQ